MFRVYYPWPSFPSISISGNACYLNCKHCNRHYLTHMIHATTPQKLVEICEKLVSKGAKGILVSGGCNSNGNMLNINNFFSAFKIIHNMGLIIKLHTGIVDFETGKCIVESGVDIASMEFVGSSETLHEIFGINLTVQDYIDTFENLKSAGMKYIAPHVAIGLHYGKLRHEFDALKTLKNILVPSTLNLVVFRPTKNTELEHIPPPTPEEVHKIVNFARQLFPDTHIVLGALRPRSSQRNDSYPHTRVPIELSALKGGISGVEIPSITMIDAIKNQYSKVKKIYAYGVLPYEYEDRVKCEFL